MADTGCEEFLAFVVFILMFGFAVSSVCTFVVTLQNDASSLAAILLILWNIFTCCIAAALGNVTATPPKPEETSNQLVKEEGEEPSKDDYTLTDEERKEKMQAMIKERDQLKRLRVEDGWRSAELTRLCDDARLAVRRDELDADGRESGALSRAEKLAVLQRDEYRSLLEKRQMRVYRLDHDIWKLETFILKDRAAGTEDSDTVFEEDLGIVKGDSEQR
jgi:hypothetical protein